MWFSGEQKRYGLDAREMIRIPVSAVARPRDWPDYTTRARYGKERDPGLHGIARFDLIDHLHRLLRITVVENTISLFRFELGSKVGHYFPGELRWIL